MKKFLSTGFATGLVALAVSAQTAQAGGSLPLFFEASRGPAASPAPFLARGPDAQFLISPTAAQILLHRAAAGPATVRMQFLGANARAQIRGCAELPGRINYLVGNDPALWQTGVAAFARVRVEEIYPGIGLVYYGNQQQLEYDFEIAPGADLDAIQMNFDGVEKIAVNNAGELILTLVGGEIRQPRPRFYQTVNGVRRDLDGGYRLLDAHTVAFVVGAYDRSLPLVIDPLLSYSTYFGGNAGEIAWAVKQVTVGTNDFIYVAGQTFSTQFSNNVPLSTPAAYQTNYRGGTLAGDAFVAKFDRFGSNLVYFTYLGGSDDDAAYALVVDSAGNAYVAGFTDSTNFPVTNAIPGGARIGGVFNPYASAYLADAFVAELDAGGSNLVYSTYLGGAGADAAYGIALDSSNNAYVTGFTYSTNFPTTTNAFQKHLGVTNSAFSSYFNANAFVAEISAGGTSLAYSTFFGGTNFDQGRSIAVDSSNYIYVAGFTASPNFPNTNAFQTYLNGTATNRPGLFDAFVAKFSPTFAGLVYSTFLGGTNDDKAYAVTVDNSGNAYVVGSTASPQFTNTVSTNIIANHLTNNLINLFPVTTNIFLTEISSDGLAVLNSAVFGGNQMDLGYGVALDANTGNIFVVGTTISTNFPVTTNNIPDGSGYLRATNSGGSDVFVTAFSNNFSNVLYSAYLGGSANDSGYGVALDPLGTAYIVGQTLSANFPTLNGRQTTRNGTNDAFLAAIVLTVVPPVVTVQPTNQVVGVGAFLTFTATATGTPPLSYQWHVSGTNLVNGGSISGATTNKLTISGAGTANSGNYQVIVTNYAGSVTSLVAVLTVTNTPVALTEQPMSQTNGVGSTITLFVHGLGTEVFFQWVKDNAGLTDGTNASGSIISGSTNFELTIRNAQTNDSGAYWIIVSNSVNSVTSSNATLLVVAVPTILSPPTNQTVGLGATVQFSVTAVGQLPLSYLWQQNGTNLAAGGHVSGATTNSSLTITNTQTTDDGGYSVIVTNLAGAVTSSPPAVLTVLTAPRFESIFIVGGTNFALSGVGGTNRGSYFVLTSSNLLLPLGSWTRTATNQFGSQGQFAFTNLAPTNTPQLFYILKMP